MKVFWIRIGVVGITTTLLVTMLGCAATTPVPATATVAPTAPMVVMDDDVLVIYHKTGGIAGIDETLTVHQGGVAEWKGRIANPKSLQLSEPTMQPLRRMIEQKDFGDLARLYQAAGADLFVYTITARDANGNAKMVTTMDLAKQPDYLGLLIVILDNLRMTVSKNG